MTGSLRAIIDPAAVTNVEKTPIGQGSFGTVYRASYGNDTVAIKRIKNSAGARKSAIDEFQSEADILMKLNHPRIVRFLGVMVENNGLSIVLEYLPEGCLHAYYTTKAKPPLSTRLSLAKDIASGMGYLHTQVPPLLHRDLKSPNILISRDVFGALRCKISDLGSATVTSLSTLSGSVGIEGSSVGTPLWMAPELNGVRLKYRPATDVFAFGVILTELASWEGPYGIPVKEFNLQSFHRLRDLGKRPDPDLDDCQDISNSFKKLIFDCISEKPDERPQFSRINEILGDITGDADSIVALEPQLEAVRGTNSGGSDPLVDSVVFHVLETKIPYELETSNNAIEIPYKSKTSDEALSQVNSNRRSIALGKENISPESAPLIDNTLPPPYASQEISKEDAAEAIFTLGMRYYKGDEIPQNLPKAFTLFLSAAKDGNAHWVIASNMLKGLKGTRSQPLNGISGLPTKGMRKLISGQCYEFGNGVQKDISRAVELYRKGVELGDAQSQYRLAHCYKMGLGVERNMATALLWYRESANKGNAGAQNNLGWFYEYGQGGLVKNLEFAKHWYLESANQGYANAQNSLGILYQSGKLGEVDLKQAFECFSKAAKQDHVSAQYKGVDKIMELAVFWYEKAAEKGDPAAQANGDGVAKDLELAVQWYKKSADQGHATAQYNLGQCYEQGNGVEKSLNKAVDLYRKAAEKGLAQSQYKLGHCYKLGLGVEKNLETALIWYQKSGDQGHAAAQNNLGWFYEYAIGGVPKDIRAALNWYLKSANQGYANAQNTLGLCYQFGNGVVKSMGKAVLWYTKAAEKGDAAAQCNLGYLYQTGQGVDKNIQIAADFYQRAADQNYTTAEFNLGQLYEYGYGVEKDLKKAEILYKKAAAKGDENAKNADPEVKDFEAGFQNSPEQPDPVRMTVRGSIPTWFSGHLYRCAPSTFIVDNLTPEATKANHGKDKFKISHWFDGLTQIHKFSVNPDGTVHYMSRKTAKDTEDYIRKTGTYGFTFGQKDPCRTFFSRFFTMANMMIGMDAGGAPANVGVTISPNFPLLNPVARNKDLKAGPRTLVAKTDSSTIQELDPVTLEPLGLRSYSDINKTMKGQVSAAHGHFDSDTKEYFNFTTEMGRTSTFRAFSISQSDPAGKVLATIPNAPLSYIHSFALTDRYVVYPFWPYTIEIFKFLWEQNFADSLHFNSSHPTLLAVIDRRSHAHVATFRAPPAFGFHTVNAWDEGEDILFDIPIADDASLVYEVYMNENLKPQKTSPKLHRYRCPNIQAAAEAARRDPSLLSLNHSHKKEVEALPVAEVTRLSEAEIELPRFHPRTHRKPYRYTYGVSSLKTTVHRGMTANPLKVFDSLVKLDVSTLPAREWVWHEERCFPGEPIFVPKPGGVDEDEGIVVSVVLRGGREGTPTSFLVVLDAKDLSEIARAEMPEAHVVPFGFHGNFYCGVDEAVEQ
ncbi:hypothetical protein HDU67_007018 [Dinochytrium kinnereticum]|nr:hypothetical protein HDU67_007018 [Dinochytrium kinnereticum]